jgi:hypothetical protein
MQQTVREQQVFYQTVYLKNNVLKDFTSEYAPVTRRRNLEWYESAIGADRSDSY